MGILVGDQTCLTIVASGNSCLNSTVTGSFHITKKLATITILGVTSKPATGSVTLNGKTISNVTYKAETECVVVGGLSGDLNSNWELKW